MTNNPNDHVTQAELRKAILEAQLEVSETILQGVARTLQEFEAKQAAFFKETDAIADTLDRRINHLDKRLEKLED